MAPWWWFPCKPKHVGAVLLILKCFNNSMFFNVVCISWILKCWICKITFIFLETAPQKVRTSEVPAVTVRTPQEVPFHILWRYKVKKPKVHFKINSQHGVSSSDGFHCSIHANLLDRTQDSCTLVGKTAVCMHSSGTWYWIHVQHWHRLWYTCKLEGKTAVCMHSSGTGNSTHAN